MIKFAILFFVITICNAYSSTLNDVVVKGNDRIEANTVMTYSGLKKNTDVDDYVISEAIKKLYRTKFFSDIAISIENGIATILIKENPIVAEVKFNGIKSSIASSLKKEMHTKDRSTYSKEDIKFDTESVKAFFIKSGSLGVIVTPRVKVLDRNRVEIIFDIDEGNDAQVDQVLFVGNKVFRDVELLNKITLRGIVWWDIFSYGNVYDESKLEYDKSIINNLYLDAGYADFKFNSVIAEYNKEVSRFSVSYFIHEGELYDFGKSEIDSHIPNFSSEKFPLDLIESNIGDRYNQSKINKTIKNISSYLANIGFVNAQIVPVIHKKDRIANIKYVIQSNIRYYINNIEITGNYKTHDGIIRRELLMVEGDLYNLDLIEQSKRRLLMSDFFDDIQFKEKINKDGTLNLEVIVKEKTRVDGINLNVGYTTIGGIIYGAGLTKKNLFGRGYTGSFQLQQAIFMSQYSLSFYNPRLLNSDLSLSLDASYTTFGSALASLPFNNITEAVGIRIGYPITEKIYQYWGFRFQYDNLEISQNVGSVLYSEMSNQAISDIISHTLVYDNRDHPLLPTKGFIARITNSLSGYTGIGGQKYIQNDLATAFYTPTINEDFILMLAFQGGHITGLENYPVLFQNRYSVGYQNFRGFFFMGVGPRVELIDANGDVSYFYGGLKSNTYAVGTVELSFPLPIPKDYMVRASFFCDFGTAFGYDGQMSAVGQNGVIERVVDQAALRLAVGIGITWIGPIGPIKIDIAQPLLYQAYDQVQMFRITFQPGPF